VAAAKRKLRIKDLPKVKRPRERLSDVGVANLTEVELLALVIGSGTRGVNAINLAKKILLKFPLKRLANAQVSDLIKIKGLGRVRAGKILASLEVGRRVWEELPAKILLTPESVIREVDEIRLKSREYLIALYLNARHELVKKHTISIGSLNQNVVEPKDVFGQALTLPSPFIILVHNHPSGDPSPSKDDKTFTKTLLKAGKLLGVEIIDHIIVSPKNYFSFREAELI